MLAQVWSAVRARLPRKSDLLPSFGIASCLLLPGWLNLATHSRFDFSNTPVVPPGSAYAALLTLLIGLALVITLLFHVVRISQSKFLSLVKYAFVVFCFLLFINVVRGMTQISIHYPWFSWLQFTQLFSGEMRLVAASILLFAFIGICLRYRRPAARSLLAFFSCMSFFGVIKGLEISNRWWFGQPYVQESLRETSSGTARLKVVWLLFDEMDYYLAFEGRPAGLPLANFDRLRAESFFATAAQPPSTLSTKLSVPSYLYGKKFTSAELVQNDSGFFITGVGAHSEVIATGATSFFHRLRQANLQTALIGWYLPYCHLFASQVRHCKTFNLSTFPYSNDFTENVFRIVGHVASASLFPATSPHLMNYLQIRSELHRALLSRQYEVIYTHFPLPHLPAIYDRKKGAVSTNPQNEEQGYLSNLALADRALGEVREALVSAKLWDDVLLVVTSDHHLRSLHSLKTVTDTRVPFFIKFPGQKAGMVYQKPFNTVVLEKVLLEHVANRLQTSNQLEGWLAR